MKLRIFIVATLFSSSWLSAQMDTIGIYENVDSINIISVRNSGEEFKQSTARRINGKTLVQNLDQLSPMTVRSGGPGMIATILRRGMASRHLGVLWEGFNIQSTVNGTFDLGLLSNSFTKVSFLSHDVNPTIGNASIAGAISLDNQLGQKATRLGVGYGSDQNLWLSGANEINLGKYSHHLALSYRDDQNRYQYYNGNQKLTQNDAVFSNLNLNYKSHIQVSDKLKIKSGLWIQAADRDIPPSKTSVNTEQTQRDQNFRYFLGADYFLNDDAKIVLRSGFFDEQLDFDAPGIESRANSDVWNIGVDYISGFGLTLSGQTRVDRVEASFFTEQKNRNTYSILGDYRSSWNDIEYAVSIRPQLVDGESTPLTYTASVSKQMVPNFEMQLLVGRGYTLPSFNDLFWPSGGNEDLLAEKSITTELTLKYKDELKDHSINFNVYHLLIDNWIQWIPQSGIFQPVNQRKVRNLGFEFLASKKWNIKKGGFQADINYAFVDSRLVKHYFDEGLEGKKTIFVPRHKISSLFGYTHDDWSVSVSPLFYSKRYDTVDNSQAVDGYFVMDAQVARKIDLSNGWTTNVSLSIENTSDSDYENIRFFPMPLRIFRLGVQLEIN